MPGWLRRGRAASGGLVAGGRVVRRGRLWCAGRRVRGRRSGRGVAGLRCAGKPAPSPGSPASSASSAIRSSRRLSSSIFFLVSWSVRETFSSLVCAYWFAGLLKRPMFSPSWGLCLGLLLSRSGNYVIGGEATGLHRARGLSFCGPRPPHFRLGKTGMPGGYPAAGGRGVYVPLPVITAGMPEMPVGRLSRDAGRAGMPPARCAAAFARAIRRPGNRGRALRRRRGRSANGCVP